MGWEGEGNEIVYLKEIWKSSERKVCGKLCEREVCGKGSLHE